VYVAQRMINYILIHYVALLRDCKRAMCDSQYDAATKQLRPGFFSQFRCTKCCIDNSLEDRFGLRHKMRSNYIAQSPDTDLEKISTKNR